MFDTGEPTIYAKDRQTSAFEKSIICVFCGKAIYPYDTDTVSLHARYVNKKGDIYNTSCCIDCADAFCAGVLTKKYEMEKEKG